MVYIKLQSNKKIPVAQQNEFEYYDKFLEIYHHF